MPEELLDHLVYATPDLYALEQHAATLEARVRELESTRGPSWNPTRPEAPTRGALICPHRRVGPAIARP